MPYELVEVNERVSLHFAKVTPLVEQKLKLKLENPRIKKVWCDKFGIHDFTYHANIKAGHLGSHQYYTVVWETLGSNMDINLISV